MVGASPFCRVPARLPAAAVTNPATSDRHGDLHRSLHEAGTSDSPNLKPQPYKESFSMKLLNILAVAAFGTLLATGCTVTSSDGDAGTDGGTDTGSATDTGGSTDTGGTTDTGAETTTDAGPKCTECQTVVCKTENDACTADATCTSQFNTSLECVKGCGTDKTCANKCVEKVTDAKATDLWNCLIDCQDKCVK